tara:strand:- start:46 stop:774 length:729 start_codon:yes stop_codon:yes gene_type:complete
MAKIPTNMRLFGQYLLGNKSPITEKDFTPQELSQMLKRIQEQDGVNLQAEQDQQAYLKAIKENSQLNWEDKTVSRDLIANEVGELVPRYTEETWRDIEQANIQKAQKKVDSFEKTRNKTSVGYADDTLVDEEIGFLDTIAKSFTSPAYNIETSLGHFNAHKNKDGTVTIKDTYDMYGTAWKEGKTLSVLDFIKVLPTILRHPEDLGGVVSRFLIPDRKRDVTIHLDPRDEKARAAKTFKDAL